MRGEARDAGAEGSPTEHPQGAPAHAGAGRCPHSVRDVLRGGGAHRKSHAIEQSFELIPMKASVATESDEHESDAGHSRG